MMVTKCRCLHVVILLLFLLHCKEGEGTTVQIVDAPRDQTVALNSIAVFTCRTIGQLAWQVEGTPLIQLVIIQAFLVRGIYVNESSSAGLEAESTLLATGTTANNGSRIQCLAISSDLQISASSNEAVLRVFDQPDSPSNFISLPLMMFHLNLSWDAPFTLPGEQISYILQVLNLNTSMMKSEELVTTSYTFSGIEGNSVCDIYQFCVIALNDAGRSECVTTTGGLPTLPDITTSISSLNHSFVIENERASIIISFEPAESCRDYPVVNYSMILESSSIDAVRVIGLPLDPLGNGKIQMQLRSPDIVENTQYNFSIVVTNSIGSVTSNKMGCFTTDVQSASVSLSNSDEEGIIVTCEFAEGSQSQGCHVQLQILSTVKINKMNISRQNGSLEAISSVITLAYPLACYEVCAFDWESDDTIGQLCIPAIIEQTSSGNETCSIKPGSVTTDVQSALIFSDGTTDGVLVNCHFAEGSQALGCYIEFRIKLPMHNITVILNIPRQNESLEATSEPITLAYPLVCYEVCAFDWESDGTRGELCVPVRVEQSQSGDAQCSDLDLPKSDQAVNLGAIVGGIVGGVLLLMLVLAVAVAGIVVYKWKTKGTMDPEMKRNPAYEIHNIRRPSRNVTSSVRTVTGSGREGVQPSAGNGISVERHLSDNEAFNTELNVAYMVL